MTEMMTRVIGLNPQQQRLELRLNPARVATIVTGL
jgi:hypothetical protein